MVPLRREKMNGSREEDQVYGPGTCDNGWKYILYVARTVKYW